MGMAMPMMLAQLINLLYSVVDRVYIGRIPDVGTLALTGLGLTFPIINILNAFANLLAWAARRSVPLHEGVEKMRKLDALCAAPILYC